MRLPFARSRPSLVVAAADGLQDAMIAQVRQPVFYTDYGVPDTFEGRFDLLILHAALVLRRLHRIGPDAQGLAQALVDSLFARFEISLREMGVSDIGVPKRMKRLAEAFKGRTAAYDAALAASDEAALAAAVARNVLGDTGDGVLLARYAMVTGVLLDGCSLADLECGAPRFPEPAHPMSA